jgi:hypothetical protein
MKSLKLSLWLTLIIMISFSCACPDRPDNGEDQRAGIIPQDVEFEALPDLDMEVKLAEFAEFELTSNLDHLTVDERAILPILFEAASIMENIFWKQAIGNKEDFLNRIKDEKARMFAQIHYGPWDRMNNNEPFLTNIGLKPEGANFYPDDKIYIGIFHIHPCHVAGLIIIG